MTKKRAATKPKKRTKRGRPTRARASAKALKGVDLSAVDPDQILRAIAADTSAPASARLQAVRELKKLVGPQQPKQLDEQEASPLARRALRILNGGRA